MPENKESITVRCPACKQKNILKQEDDRGREKITFKCRECEHWVTVNKPALGADAGRRGGVLRWLLRQGE